MGKGTSALAGAGTGAATGASVAGPWGAVIGALVGAVGGLIINDTTNYENKKRQEENQAWQESQVQQQNVYNSPAEQMKRYKEAGINPSTLGMASGALAGGNLSASPQGVPTVPYQSYDITHALSNMTSALYNTELGLSEKTLRQARLDEIENHIKEYQANVQNLNLNSQSVLISNQFISAEKTWAIRESQGRVKKLTSEFGWNYQQIAESRQRVQGMIYELENILPEEVKKMVSERNLNVIRQDEVVATIADLKASAALKTEQTNTEEIRQADVQQDVAGKAIENANRQDLIDKYLEKYGAEINKLAAEAGLTKEQAYWYVFDLADKNTMNFMGVPLAPGQAYRKMQRGRALGKEVRNRYNVE